MNLDALMKKADSARPLSRAANVRWVDILPLYLKLRERKLTGKDAVEWMIREKVIQESDRAKAQEALQKLQRRRVKAS